MRRAKEQQLGGATQLYSTPHWCVHRLLDAVELPRGRWLEAGCGVGAIIRAVDRWRADDNRPYSYLRWDAFELDDRICHAGLRRINQFIIGADRRLNMHRGDFLSQWALESMSTLDFDVAIMNPPNDLAEAFIRRAAQVAAHVLVFQPLQFYASQEREELFRLLPLERLLVLPDRPKFAGESSPMQTYAWYHFVRPLPGRPRPPTVVSRLALTRLEVRKDQAQQQAREDLEDFPIAPATEAST